MAGSDSADDARGEPEGHTDRGAGGWWGQDSVWLLMVAALVPAVGTLVSTLLFGKPTYGLGLGLMLSIVAGAIVQSMRQQRGTEPSE